ncbi:multidrug effflux MFS transporter [Pseudoruegeria sp. SK021]|uniref:multidrug effflux MFS transporter n=1 Tax=Pseudoruegeria sp. SK021 TaxID=1933035 RepID=UPI000A219DA2|nr:multidrug effflux MFS transporter [Pseudoruegeria sp. SK021]OSP53829.1 Bcr/CflA family drug resistance efflux transporter [Pseudoruegeria sp. SK021]
MSPRPKVRFLDRRTPPHIMTLVILTGLNAATMNIYLPSLPHMAAHFQTDYGVMQLSVSLFLAVTAVLQLFLGPLSDRIGRRPVILGALCIYVLATLGTLYAPTIELFLMFRMAQGVVVAGMVLGRAVVRDMYPQDQSASMIGYVTMGMAIVPMMAPLLGGTLDQLFGWKANFWVLLSLGVTVLALAWWDMGETATRQSKTLSEQMREAPELLTSPRFWGYSLAAMFSSGAFFSYLGGAPFVGTQVFGLNPAELGFFFGAPAVGYVVGNAISGAYSVRLGINALAMAGALCVALGTLASLLVVYAGFGTVWTFFGFTIFVGLGNGMVLPNATAGMLSVRPKLAGTASGLGGAMMIGGGAALSSLSGAVLTPESGVSPLLWVMLGSSLLSFAAMAMVLRRARILARTEQR